MDFKIINIELKTSNLCNAKCEYCYVPEFIHPEILTTKDMIKAFNYIKNMKTNSSHILHFLWHGGEPSLMRPEYFVKAIEQQKLILVNHSIVNFFQTNGLNISEALLDLFEKESFLVGISLDGPQKLHDKLRIDKNNNPTYDRVISTFNRLKNRNIPVIINCVLRKESLLYLDEIYKLISELNAFVTFNILLPPKGDTNILTTFEFLNSQEYGEAIVHFLSKWLNDSTYTATIDTFNYLIWSILYNKKAGCFKAECPHSHRAITPYSNLFMCGRFYGWKDKSLMLNIDLSDIKLINHEIDLLFPSILCEDCKISINCNGGCPYDRIAFGNSINKIDSYCISYKKISDFVFENKISIVDKLNKIVMVNENATKLFYYQI